MLTGDLVRTRIQKGELRPSFVDPASERLIERAEELRTAFAEHIGAHREDLDAQIGLIAGDGVDHKLTSGLAKILFDRATFDVAAPIPPAEVRAAIFRAAARRGPLAGTAVEGGRVTGDQLWAELGAERGLSVDAVRGCLYADHADQQVLTSVDVPSAEWLLHRYNVALVQAVLLRATEIRVDLVRPAPGRARQLARALKFHQLLFAMAPTADGYRLTLDGPTSLFSQTTRYGLSLARFFPALVLQPGAWSMEADVTERNRDVVMRVSSDDGLRSHYKDLGGYDTREALWFAERFEALGSGWELRRDAEPLTQGGEAVVVPDFSFHRDGRVAHLEILGFWRKGTVPGRLALLKKHGPSNLVLAVSRRLCADPDGGELPAAVVPFAEVIPAKEVLARVEACAVATDVGRTAVVRKVSARKPRSAKIFPT